MKATAKNQNGQSEPKASAPLSLDIQHILVPVDFSAPSRRAVQSAVEFAGKFGAKITLLHVVAPLDQPGFDDLPLTLSRDKVLKMAQRKLAVLARPRPGGASPIGSTLVRTGKPYHEITAAARELKVDLIVIATHGYTGLKLVLLGSTAERVVRYAPCAVLILRETEAVSR